MRVLFRRDAALVYRLGPPLLIVGVIVFREIMVHFVL